MPREIRKTIRFSESEFETIKIIMHEHNLTFAEFARGVILRKKIKTNLTKDMIFEVNRIGNNLNQIARKVNQNSNQRNLLLTLIEIKNELKKIGNVY